MASGQEVSLSSTVVYSKNLSRRNSGLCCHRHLKILHTMLVSTAHIHGNKIGASAWAREPLLITFVISLPAMLPFSFFLYVSYDGMLAP